MAEIVVEQGTDMPIERMSTRIGARAFAKAVPITRRVVATLTGVDFTIVPAQPDSEQLVIPGEPTSWQFSVTPRKAGALTLHASISDRFDTAGVKGARSVHVKDLEVAVRADYAGQARQIVAQHWDKILGGIGGTGVLGLIGKLWVDRRKSPQRGRRKPSERHPASPEPEPDQPDEPKQGRRRGQRRR